MVPSPLSLRLPSRAWVAARIRDQRSEVVWANEERSELLPGDKLSLSEGRERTHKDQGLQAMGQQWVCTHGRPMAEEGSEG